MARGLTLAGVFVALCLPLGGATRAQGGGIPDAVFADNWSSSDANGAINASLVFGGQVYLGGAFTTIGGISASGVASFDGKQYHALGSGIGGSSFGTLAVKALTVFNNKVVAAGSFTTAGGVACNSIAAWDPAMQTWSSLGSGLSQSGGSPADVHCLTVANVGGMGMELFAGGFFNVCGASTPCLNIAAWTGSAWQDPGGGVNATINALAGFNGALYSGGSGSSSTRLRFWTGTGAWTQVPGGTISGNSNRVNALLTSGGYLWIGGSFTNGGGITTSPNIVAFNGTAFQGAGAGLADATIGVACLAEHDDGAGVKVVAGGGFTGRVQATGNLGGGIWSTVANGLDNSPNTLCSFSSGAEHDLFAGTSSALMVNTPGQMWTNPGDGVNGSFSSVTGMTAGLGWALAAQQIIDTLYITGVFNAFINSTWTAQATVQTARQAMARTKCTNSLRDLAYAAHKYNSSALGAGMDAAGNSCSYWGGGGTPFVAFAGAQTSAGGLPAGGLSFFYPSTGTWQNPALPPHTGGFFAYVQGPGGATNPYVMGSFSNTGTPGLDFFGALTGTGLAAVSCGPNNTVRGMVHTADSRYLRWGDYTSLGCPGQSAGFVDEFFPATGASLPWSSQLFDAPVLAACTNPAQGLYVGGRFTLAGSTTVNHVAFWNGAAWQALGSGMNGDVAAMTMWDDGTGPNLYVAGAFTSAGGQPANRIARWNGVQWSAVGGGTENGLNAQASSLAVVDYGDEVGPSLMIGGSFTRAGGLSSGRLAQVVMRGPPVIATQPAASTTAAPGGSAAMSLRAYRSPPLIYRWRKGGVNLSDGPAPGGSVVAGSATASLTIAGVSASDAATYDCVVSNTYGGTTSIGAMLVVGTGGCSVADIVSIGGLPPPDGLLTGDDFNAFIGAFAIGDALADIVGIGGLPPPDGLVTGDDFNAFISAFAPGCP